MVLWILEKAFDRVSREVISWAICKLGVEEWLVSAVMSMYSGAKTVVRTVYGNSNGQDGGRCAVSVVQPSVFFDQKVLSDAS